jgi:hypothetical protein
MVTIAPVGPPTKINSTSNTHLSVAFDPESQSQTLPLRSSETKHFNQHLALDVQIAQGERMSRVQGRACVADARSGGLEPMGFPCGRPCLEEEEPVDLMRCSGLGASDALVRIDDRHFCISGSAEELASGTCVSFLGGDAQLSKLVQRAVTILLDAQCIRSRMLPDLLFRVVKGSGVGFVHSSSVADACFAYRCEQNLDTELHDGGVVFH